MVEVEALRVCVRRLLDEPEPDRVLSRAACTWLGLRLGLGLGLGLELELGLGLGLGLELELGC